MFIAIDGIDGSGITTHCKLLCNWIESLGLKVHLTKEPSSGKIGELIRHYLKLKDIPAAVDALLFAADRVEHCVEIKSYLDKGYIVISDRYVESSRAYQVAEGLPPDWVDLINRYAITPDLNIILDVEPRIALKRKFGRDIGDEKFEELEFLTRVREIMLKNARLRNYPIVDTNKSIEEVHRSLREIILGKFRDVGIII